MSPQDSISLLGSTLAAVTHTRCDDPLVGLADLARLVSSFRLKMGLDICIAGWLCDITYRHTPGADGIDVTLRFTSSTTVGMVAYMVIRDGSFEAGKELTYRRSWQDHGR